MITVTPFDRGRFLCSSETNAKDEYIVDVIEGTCECMDFVANRKHKFKLTCKHLRRCRDYLADEVIQALKEQDEEP